MPCPPKITTAPSPALCQVGVLLVVIYHSHVTTATTPQIGLRVPAVFISPSVPRCSVLRPDRVRTTRSSYPSTDGPAPGGIPRLLNHASLSATFHHWFGTEYLNEVDLPLRCPFFPVVYTRNPDDRGMQHRARFVTCGSLGPSIGHCSRFRSYSR